MVVVGFQDALHRISVCYGNDDTGTFSDDQSSCHVSVCRFFFILSVMFTSLCSLIPCILQSGFVTHFELSLRWAWT